MRESKLVRESVREVRVGKNVLPSKLKTFLTNTKSSLHFLEIGHLQHKLVVRK